MAETREAPPVPASHVDLLQRPLFAGIGTVRPDGQPQVNPMWFEWDGSRLRFTCTRSRQKHRNASHEPRVSVSILDPERPYRYLEVRGVVEEIEPDPIGSLFDRLAAPADATSPPPTSSGSRDAGLDPRAPPLQRQGRSHDHPHRADHLPCVRVHSAEALVALALLSFGGPCPPRPRRQLS